MNIDTIIPRLQRVRNILLTIYDHQCIYAEDFYRFSKIQNSETGDCYEHVQLFMRMRFFQIFLKF